MAREQSLAKSIKEKIIKALTESHYPMYHDVSIFQSKTVYIYIITRILIVNACCRDGITLTVEKDNRYENFARNNE